MAKTKSVYVCQNCGVQSPKWLGKCPSCNEWNTFVEEIITRQTSGAGKAIIKSSNLPQKISEVNIELNNRLATGIPEFDRILGGGIVPGSVILLGGEPGIGKSTLALQLAMHLGNESVLYVSGEESAGQIKLRAERLSTTGNEPFYILCETNLQNILFSMEEMQPGFLIVDSIQTLYTENIESTQGSVAQIRECANALLRQAKKTGVPVLLIGHINKEGAIAGPKVLEHIVDVVLQFEGEHANLYRILRSLKNRFGSTAEIAIFEMQSKGLIEVTNPSDILLDHHDEPVSGVARAAMIEGIRPLLIETQALVSTATYGTPQRSTTGFDVRRLHMLLAVLEKKAGFRLAAKDVFLNIAGGLKVTDTATDLAVISAVLSSTNDTPVPFLDCFAGEVGLSGEIRSVSRIEQRIAEAERMGFKRIFISRFNRFSGSTRKSAIEVIQVTKVEHLYKYLFS